MPNACESSAVSSRYLLRDSQNPLPMGGHTRSGTFLSRCRRGRECVDQANGLEARCDAIAARSIYLKKQIDQHKMAKAKTCSSLLTFASSNPK